MFERKTTFSRRVQGNIDALTAVLNTQELGDFDQLNTNPSILKQFSRTSLPSRSEVKNKKDLVFRYGDLYVKRISPLQLFELVALEWRNCFHNDVWNYVVSNDALITCKREGFLSTTPFRYVAQFFPQYAFSYGMAEEEIKLLSLSDRNASNVLITPGGNIHNLDLEFAFFDTPEFFELPRPWNERKRELGRRYAKQMFGDNYDKNKSRIDHIKTYATEETMYALRGPRFITPQFVFDRYFSTE